MKSIKVCEYSRSRSFHDDLILQDQASGERSQDQWSSGTLNASSREWLSILYSLFTAPREGLTRPVHMCVVGLQAVSKSKCGWLKTYHIVVEGFGHIGVHWSYNFMMFCAVYFPAWCLSWDSKFNYINSCSF